MSIFRREHLINKGPGRLVVHHDPERSVGVEVFYVNGQGWAKEIASIRSAEECSFVCSSLVAACLECGFA